MKIPVTISFYVESPRGVFDDPGSTMRTVFAEVTDVGMNEYYQAMSNGLNAEIAFEMTDFADYDGEKLLLYNGTPFRVIRATRRGMRQRLICEKVDRNAP